METVLGEEENSNGLSCTCSSVRGLEYTDVEIYNVTFINVLQERCFASFCTSICGGVLFVWTSVLKPQGVFFFLACSHFVSVIKSAAE